MQTSSKFCEVFADKFISLSTKLYVVSCKYFCHLPPHQFFTILPIFERKSAEQSLLQRPG